MGNKEYWKCVVQKEALRYSLQKGFNCTERGNIDSRCSKEYMGRRLHPEKSDVNSMAVFLQMNEVYDCGC